ncbi:MAG: GNAT family N-acetyltransferase [Candidatus Aminicenantes bacterium]|jgi:GNAT superfamily N-acetyltransferase
MRYETSNSHLSSDNLEFSIVKRPLKKEESRLLVEKIKYTPNISGYTAREWRRCKHVFVAENSRGGLLGACMNDDFARKWTEIAVLFVLEEYRGKGIGNAFLRLSLKDLSRRHRNILMISRNPLVTQMMKKAGFEIFPRMANLPGLDKKTQFILTWYYQTRWLMNGYRIYEILRKKIKFKPNAPVAYGFKLI